MRVVHDPEGAARPLATDVETADTFRRRLVGLMGRTTVPPDYALVFPFERAGVRGVHTVFVRTPVDVLWLRAGTVTQVETLPAWRGYGAATADTVVELRAGAAEGVAVGDTVVVEG
ncbi:MAG: DUF192 domain-containing protein [Halorientalis sp.]